MRLILASKSPRRIELLGFLGLPFTACEPLCDEEVPGEAPERVRELALRKALSVSGEMLDALVLGADTLVERDGVILGKPGDAKEAKGMLRALSGGWHSVHTGLALVSSRGQMPPVQRVESARVRFTEMPDGFIEAYVASGEPMDKAGAYGIQGQAAERTGIKAAAARG